MEHVVADTVNNVPGFYHHAVFHESISGKYDFTGMGLQDVYSFLRIPKPVVYYEALSRTLRVMRDSVVEEGPVLTTIVGWELMPPQTTLVIMAIDQAKDRFGYEEREEQEVVVIQEMKPDPLPPSLIMEGDVCQDPDEEADIRAEVIPKALSALHVVLALTEEVDVYSYCDGADVVSFLKRYVSLPWVTAASSTGIVPCGDDCPPVDFIDWVGTIPPDGVGLIVADHVVDVDAVIRLRPDLRLLVIGADTQWLHPMLEEHTVRGAVMYSKNFPVSWIRLGPTKVDVVLYTDFFDPTVTYRLTTERERDLLLRHVFLSSQVHVSSLTPHLLRGFDERNIHDPGPDDVGFVVPGFDDTLKFHVSLDTGRVYMNRILPLLDDDVDVIEGVFLPIRDLDRGPQVTAASGVRYVHCVKSCSVLRREIGVGGRVKRVIRYAVSVYSRKILSTDYMKLFDQGSYEGIPRAYKM